MKINPIRSLRGLMMTRSTPILGTCAGEVERINRKEMVWVSLIKGSGVATLDGIFNAEELRHIADWVEGKEAPKKDVSDEVIGPNPLTGTIQWGRRVFYVSEKNGGYVATDGHYIFEGKTYADLRTDAIRKLGAIKRLREEYGLDESVKHESAMDIARRLAKEGKL